ncbi:MAG: ATP-binding cassette domain-containing protein [Actinomycetota bacterium]|nr:ATP-binding cassette domain-containing protein [Actinomycetota bacterium]
MHETLLEARPVGGRGQRQSAHPATAAIRAEGLRREFDGVAAVENLDLRVASGEIYGFLGPNGAGKSTTVRMLCTLLAPTGGRATIAGYDVATEAEEVRLRIGVALQEAALDAKQTGVELLALQGRLYGLTRRQVARRIDELADLIDIGAALGRLIRTYSGGMKRRLDVAAALMHNPHILFLDEPTTGLDPISRARLWEEVRGLNRDLGMTIFLTTQYLEEADALADRVGILSDGRLVAEGTPEELKRGIGADVITARVDGDPHAARRAVLGVDLVDGVEIHGDELSIATADGSRAISPVVAALNDGFGSVREITLRTPTLDDVFLELTGHRIERTDTSEEENR